MGRDIERFFEEFLPCSDSGILEEIRAFMETDDLIDVYHIEADEYNKIFVNVTLKKYSYLAAQTIFLGLARFMRRSYFSVYAGEETGERMRYLFVTGMPEKDGFKMEVMIG